MAARGLTDRGSRRPWPIGARARRLIAAGLAVAVLAALIVLALAKIDLKQVGRALGHVGGGWVALAVLLMIATFLARAESWFAAIRAALPASAIGRLTVVRVLLIGMLGSSVAPGRVGEAARAWLIARHAGGARRTLATVVGTLLSQTLLNLLALTILTVIALAGGAIHGVRVAAILAIATVPAGILGALLLVPRLIGRSDGIAGRGPVGRPVVWVARQLGDVGRGLAVFRRPRSATHSAGLQLAGWTLQLGACYALILAFDLQHVAGISTAAAILVAVNVTAVFPLTPSNLGVFQAACIAALATVGVRAATGLAYGLVLQAVEVGCATALGLPSLLGEGMSPRELRRRATAPRPAEPAC